jgi:hypothetical protein
MIEKIKKRPTPEPIIPRYMINKIEISLISINNGFIENNDYYKLWSDYPEIPLNS